MIFQFMMSNFSKKAYSFSFSTKRFEVGLSGANNNLIWSSNYSKNKSVRNFIL